jgi:hypothetical protein
MERHRDKKLTAPKLALIFCSPKISAQNLVLSRIRPLAGGSKYFAINENIDNGISIKI